MSRFFVGLTASLVCFSSGVADAQDTATVVPHVPNTTVHEVTLEEGQVLEASTCAQHGGGARGDTVLVVFGPGGNTYQDDDACGSLASHLVVRVPEGGAGRYRVRAQCYGGGRCGGQVAIWARDVRPGETFGSQGGGLRHEPWVRLQATAELLLGVENAGAGGLFETRMDARPAALLGLHVRMSPLGIAGGEVGGVLAGSARGFVSLDMIELAVGVGGGAGALSSRLTDSANTAEPLLGLYLRFGNLAFGYLETQLWLGVNVFEPMLLEMEGRIPLDDFELLLRGRAGFDGVVQGQAGLVFWLPPAARREVGVFALAGFGGLFYQPVCRFGAPCLDTNWYIGPTLGTGLEWRP